MTANARLNEFRPLESAKAAVEVVRQENEILVRLTGRLDAHSLVDVWPGVFNQVPANGGQTIRTDMSAVSYCDGAGLGLLVALDRTARRSQRKIIYEGLSPDLSKLLERARLREDGTTGPPPKHRVLAQIGRSTAETLADVKSIFSFLGEVVAALVWGLASPRRIRFADALLVAEKAGVNAVPVVCLLGGLMGLIISFQSAAPLRQLGVESMIPMMLAVSMVRELGPLLTAIILAGRSGSAFAAELGTMKVTEEINALSTFGLDPVKFLVLPRLLAAMIVTPLLSLFGTLCGLIGGYVVMVVLGYGFPFYVNEIKNSVNYVDLLQGMFKSMVFAFLIAGVGCMK